MDASDIEKRFVYHPPSPEMVEFHESARRKCRELAYYLNELLPEGREKSLAITHLEDVLMWANAAIARSSS